MSAAREAILGAIRRTLGSDRDERVDPGNIVREADGLVGDPARFQPKFDDMTNRARFIARATSERLTATVDEIAGIGDVPAAVGRYLMSQNLAPSIALQPVAALGELDWARSTATTRSASTNPSRSPWPTMRSRRPARSSSRRAQTARR